MSVHEDLAKRYCKIVRCQKDFHCYNLQCNQEVHTNEPYIQVLRLAIHLGHRVISKKLCPKCGVEYVRVTLDPVVNVSPEFYTRVGPVAQDLADAVRFRDAFKEEGK